METTMHSMRTTWFYRHACHDKSKVSWLSCFGGNDRGGGMRHPAQCEVSRFAGPRNQLSKHDWITYKWDVWLESLMWMCLICESAMLLRPPAPKTALQLEQNPEQTFSRCSSLERLWRCSHWHSGCYYPSRCRKCRLMSVFRASESREVASKSIFPVSRGIMSSWGSFSVSTLPDKSDVEKYRNYMYIICIFVFLRFVYIAFKM